MVAARLQGLRHQGVLRQLLPARSRDVTVDLSNASMRGASPQCRADWRVTCSTPARDHDRRSAAPAARRTSANETFLPDLRRRPVRRRHRRGDRVPRAATAALATVTAVQPPAPLRRAGRSTATTSRLQREAAAAAAAGSTAASSWWSPEVLDYLDDDDTRLRARAARAPVAGRCSSSAYQHDGFWHGDGHAPRARLARTALGRRRRPVESSGDRMSTSARPLPTLRQPPCTDVVLRPRHVAARQLLRERLDRARQRDERVLPAARYVSARTCWLGPGRRVRAAGADLRRTTRTSRRYSPILARARRARTSSRRCGARSTSDRRRPGRRDRQQRRLPARSTSSSAGVPGARHRAGRPTSRRRARERGIPTLVGVLRPRARRRGWRRSTGTPPTSLLGNNVHGARARTSTTSSAASPTLLDDRTA